MDYFASFDISASGMSVQKTRLDTVALNLANVNTTRSVEGGPYRRLQVLISEQGAELSAFAQQFNNHNQLALGGAKVAEIRATEEAPRLVYEPAHPDADQKGFVAYPAVNPVSEMVTLLEATRAYEANVRVMNAAKTMALRALQIGEG